MRARHIVVLAVLAVVPWGCTALVQFVDMDAGCAGGACLDATTTDAATVDAPTDAVPPFDAASVCRRKDGGVLANGYYCGYSTLLGAMTPSPDTLVHCDAGGATLIPCDAGCVTFPPGLPDWCNTCGGRAGRFCGIELGVPGADGRRYLIECSAGKMSPLNPCDAGCTSADGASSCK